MKNMLPGHCKDVAVKQVDFELTEEGIARAIEGKKAYTRCDHYVLRNGPRTAVVAVTKAEGKELFRPILEHRVLALPADIEWVRDDAVNVLNASSMARVAARYPGRTVVVEGLFGHVSFVQPHELIHLEVLDVVPPRPSKLSVLVELALASGMVDLPVVPRYTEIDLNDLVKDVRTPAVIFPCEASGLEAGRKTYYLDQIPEVEEDATLVGCDLSARIFRTLYHREVPRVEMCPQELAPRDGRPRLVKCCRVREGFQLKDGLAIVPWGVTVHEVAAALNALLSPSA